MHETLEHRPSDLIEKATINDNYLTSKSLGKMPLFVLARQLDYDETIPRHVARKDSCNLSG